MSNHEAAWVAELERERADAQAAAADAAALYAALDASTPSLDVSFFVPMVPKPSNKRRAFVINGRATVVQDGAVKSHQREFAAICADARPLRADGSPALLDVPVVVDLVVVLKRPASLSGVSKRTGLPLQSPERRWHASRPDCDNLAKTVLDSLRAWWVDDSQVVGLRTFKVIAALGESPGYHVRIRNAAVCAGIVGVTE